MIRGAGILFMTAGGQVLFLKRGPGGDMPGAWCFPGGTTEGDETAEQTAIRETTEEIGSLPDGERAELTRSVSGTSSAPVEVIDTAIPGSDIAPIPGPQIDFTTFVQKIDAPFEPTINGEHVGFAWAPVDQPPEPLHPGCRIALARLGMDELGVARAIAADELTSPQTYANVTLFALRITGTGQAYRSGLKEHVWRPPEEYLTDEFLARCNGLPVIWKHPPKKPVIDSAEFSKRVIGTIMLPYIKGDEVWGVAKIYDAEAVEMMSTRQLSTSPGVFDVGDNTVKLEDGSSILIEEKPRLLDHLAICEAGVWDKDGAPTGVQTQDGANTMNEDEKKAAEEKARADAATAEKEGLDKLLSRVDAALTKMDAMSTRMDAYDAVKSRRDAEEKESKEKADRKDALCAKRDAKKDGETLTEAEEKELAELEGGKSKTAADSKKDESEEKKEEEKEEAKDKKDEAKAASRKDNAELRSRLDAQGKELEDLRRATAPVPEAEHASLAEAQSRCDSVAQMFGETAPRPLAGETLLAYRKRLIKPFVKHSPEWARADSTTVSALPESAFGIAEDQIYRAASIAARNPVDLPPATLRTIRKTDPETGQVIREFVGDAEACWGRFKSPSRRVTNFLTPQTRH